MATIFRRAKRERCKDCGIFCPNASRCSRCSARRRKNGNKTGGASAVYTGEDARMIRELEGAELNAWLRKRAR